MSGYINSARSRRVNFLKVTFLFISIVNLKMNCRCKFSTLMVFWSASAWQTFHYHFPGFGEIEKTSARGDPIFGTSGEQKRAPYFSHLLKVSFPSHASGNECLLCRKTEYMFMYLHLRDTINTKQKNSKVI